jgi:ABC-2 type transport system permease protein
MAGLNGESLRPISASQQFSAIAYLRWRLFVNAFRRKGGAGELVARIIVYPIGFGFLLGPTIGSGIGAWAMVSDGHVGLLSALFWGITLLQIFVSINISQPGLSFDPESLIRFPVTFPRYLTVRLFLGLLSASTIVGTFCLLAAAVGTTVAQPSLGVVAFAAAISLASANMLFVRMIFAWIDRWLSTRRARELFTGFIILVSLGIQYLNFTYNVGFSKHNRAAQKQKMEALRHFYHSAQGVLSHFPAGLAGASLGNVAHGAAAYAVLNLAAVLVFAALFLAVFAWRMQREYRGESLSDSGSLATPTARVATKPRVARAVVAPVSEKAAGNPVRASGLSPELSACFYKEWIYVRRNTSQLYGMLAPLALVFIWAAKMGSSFHGNMWAFPGAVAYSTLGIAALSYNAFGVDASGIQSYLLAPVRMRTVVFAKNTFSFAISALEAVVVYGVLTFVSVRPDTLTTIATLCWLVFAVLVNITVGNMRSVIAPKKMDPGKLQRRQTSQLSGLLAVLLVAVVGGIGFGVMVLCKWLGMAWLPIPVFLGLGGGAVVLYLAGLDRLDSLVAKHRESMIEELCKAS